VRGARFWVSAALTYALLLLVSLFVDVVPWLRVASQKLYTGLGLPSSEAAYLTIFTFQAWASGIGYLIVLWIVVRIEKPADWKAFFTLDKVDWPGVWLYVALLLGLAALEALFLRRLVWTPIENWLISLGFWTETLPSQLPRRYLWLNLLVLPLMTWLEALEEIYFRGYLQRQMTKRLGAFWGITLSVLLWDLWHLQNPAAYVRRFFAGLISGLTFHLRGRVWGPMIGHPAANRVNAIQWLFSSRWLHAG
jgi:membrane protease YdiL (CAAX protease family)